MSGTGVTASRVIGLAEELERQSKAFYEGLAERFPDRRRLFISLARQCQKHQVSLVRTYRETVNDALEVGFSFEGLDLEGYRFETALPDSLSSVEIIEQAVELERQAVAFYESAAEHSRSLLATIAVAFETTARKRGQIQRELEALLD